jgi:predicted amidohydrolase YtcJ
METGDQLYFGGDIYTVDYSRPTAEAVAVSDGRITAVGSRRECESAMGGEYESFDLAGRAMLPGFIDTHLHPLLLVYFELNLQLTGVGSIMELQEKIKEAAQDRRPDDWVVGLQFDEEALDDPRFPTRRELDVACADRPVMVVKHDGHTVIANTRAIEIAGISAATPDPRGGTIDREPDGYPAGTFREEASARIKSKVPIPDMRSIIDGAASVFGRLASYGLTSLGAVMQTDENGPAGAEGAFEIPLLQLVLEQVPFNLYGLLIAHDLAKVDEARKTPLHQPEVPGGHRIGGVKIYADGTYGSCTAYMEEPFTDQPDKRGYLVLEPGELYRQMVAAHRAGLQIAIHAIGDAANRVCVELYDRLLREYPRQEHRHRLEHASQLDKRIIAEIARLGLVVSTQPMFIHSEKSWLPKRLGSERTWWTYPFRSLLEAGVKLAGASDGPVESTEVLHAIQCCVTREGFEPRQSIMAAQAVRMFTIDAAFAQFEEGVKGSITAGKRADLVVLSANPVRVPPEEISSVVVERTVVGGRVIHEI